jgi:transposase
VPGLPRLKAKRTIEPTAEALLAAIESYRERAKRAGHAVQRVIAERVNDFETADISI